MFLDMLDRTEVTYDGPLILTCTATATPRPEISWYYEESMLVSGNNNVVISEAVRGERVLESTLNIVSPFLDRQGSYSCIARNVVGMVTSSSELIIYCELRTGIPPFST